MPVTRVDSPKNLVSKSPLLRAVDLAMADVKKVQSRMTEELRAEDAIKGIAVAGDGKVTVTVDSHYDFKPAGLKQLVADLLKKHGATASVSLVKAVVPEDAVKAAAADVATIQHRKTRELRVEDGIKSVSYADGSVLVTLKPGQPYDKKNIEAAVKRLLADHGLQDARIALADTLPPAAQKKQAAVDESWMSIFQIQHRMTADIRAEDDIVGLSLDGDTVRVALRAHTNSSDAEIKAAVTKQLADHGLKNAKLEMIRPAIDPIFIHPPGPVTGGLTTSPLKSKVESMNADLKKVHARLTEEIRIEDGVKSVAVKGAKVIVTVQQSAVNPDAAAEWAKAELKKRGVTLPVVIKGLDTVSASDAKIAKGLYASLNNHGGQLRATAAGSEPKWDDKKGLMVNDEGHALLEVRLRFATGGAPMPTTSALVDPQSNTYYTRTDDPMGRTGSKWEGPQVLPAGARFAGGGYSVAQVKKLADDAEKGVPVVSHNGPPRP